MMHVNLKEKIFNEFLPAMKVNPPFKGGAADLRWAGDVTLAELKTTPRNTQLWRIKS